MIKKRTPSHDIDDDIAFELIAQQLNTAVKSIIDRKQREKNGVFKKERQKKVVDRKLRLKRYYQHKINDRKKLMQASSLISFVGNWRGSSRYVKGHTHRSSKLHYNQLSTSRNDSLIVVDEYRSTITCNP